MREMIRYERVGTRTEMECFEDDGKETYLDL